ncbi:hypothetical protein NFHSH190041_17000 [Shewanella sp. NFH-SH190041]|uniref:SMI1/KNR4 family protein n=1 Tax=Shewanella sp. NFH-SH190041 TaxID=2950245 RepID=UPI0021C3C6CE|nr:SMI1/KNR4 family protein [Shewanella sp. NFH-SH190041]BDM64248.1 hypothetical protein NFHSH190041_17000 [Shewanella sp. NFH-SH190041]
MLMLDFKIHRYFKHDGSVINTKMRYQIMTEKNILSILSKVATPLCNGIENNLPTEVEIKTFETTHGVILPKDLKEILLNWDGFNEVTTFGPNCNSRLVLPLPNGKFGYDYEDFNCTLTSRCMFKNYDDPFLGLPNYSLPIFFADGGDIFVTLWPGAEGQVYHFQTNYDYISENETEIISNYEPDTACDLFDPINNNIPYYFTKLSNSFTDFVQQLLFIDVKNFDDVNNECLAAGKPLDISRLIQYELPENYSSHN